VRRFVFKDTGLYGLKRIERQSLGDNRGFLSRLFCIEELSRAGWHKPIKQINHTYTAERGTVRGLHYQLPPYTEMKLVSCIRGEVWDLVVDLRAGSPTFLCVYVERLSADNGVALLIPDGCAHGFQALTDHVELIYCHSEAYAPLAEAGLNPKDPKLDIRWPLPITEISERDTQHPILEENFTGLTL
jgi:dTDP-4-dehydrorhamnose 3,5-epimerase